jgi:hypothetical protein
VRGMKRRGPRLEWVVAIGIAMVSPLLSASGGVTTTTSIGSAQTSQSSAQSYPSSGTVCSLTAVTASVTTASGTPTGTLTIKDEISGSPVVLGTQTLVTGGQASFTFALSSGPHTLIATYSGDSTYQESTSLLPASANISSQCDSAFVVTMSSLSPSSTLTAGEQGTATVTVTPLPTFVEAMGSTPAFISVSCSGLPEQASCNFTPQNLEILPGQNQGVTSQMSFQTQAATTSMRAVPPAGQGHGSSPIAWAFLLPGALGLGGLAWGARRRRWLQRLVLMALVGLVMTLGATACSPLYSYYHHGPPPPAATPAGTYTIVLTGQSNNGVTAITDSTNFTVTVQ